MPHVKRDPLTRFMAGVGKLPECGCWIYPIEGRSTHYGRFWTGDKYQSAHVYAYEAFVGPVPAGSYVRHSCDVRCCVNPAHLSIGSQSDNIRDAIARGRYDYTTRARGSKAPTAVLTEDLVIKIRNSTKRTADLSRELGVTFSTVSHARKGLTWRHVPLERPLASGD